MSAMWGTVCELSQIRETYPEFYPYWGMETGGQAWTAMYVSLPKVSDF
ncbi:hypothetical protein GCM10011273_15830 [Asticcacaulis endophyticus]|uniref:Uncharacterized protein n=1 Tax=Asticcacaulis endophyticus TaxID=1395890 RepID=A0A918Q2R7_9CAUL|nr:hypothetical protein GCM10011273_15830 [Asticcacaulis endophyticus]